METGDLEKLVVEKAHDIHAKRICQSRSDSQLRSFVAKFKWNKIEAYVLELHARQQKQTVIDPAANISQMS